MDEKFNKVIEKFKELTKKECYRVELTDEIPDILDNKIGGKPYLPLGEEYPKDNNGNYMPLLLQINLADINLEDYPKTGILEIFTDKDVEYPCQYAIRYFEDGKEYQEELPEIDASNYIVNEPSKIELFKDNSYMPVNDYRFVKTMNTVTKEVYGIEVKNFSEIDQLFGDNNWYEVYQNTITNPLISIGGYAEFTQFDPREGKIYDKDECIFKLDSYYGNGINIGDVGILFVLISQQDIENSNFRNAIVDWDCS